MTFFRPYNFMSIKELLTFLSFRSMLLESVSYITDDVMVDGGVGGSVQ